MNAFRWMRRLDPLQAREQLRVVVERQPRVQAVDDVDLGDRVGGGDARAQPPQRLLVRHRVGAGVAGLEARERAEHAARLAHVGGVDVHVAVEERAVAVQALAHLVGERADLQQVRVLVERDAVVERQRLAGAHLVADRGEAHGVTSCSEPSAMRSHGQQARAADQRHRLLARQRRVVGVGAEAQRALGDDRREELVGAEAERHLREARPQRGHVGEQVRHARQRQPAEREAAERVEAERLADGRRHDAPGRRRGGGDRGQALEPLRVALAQLEREAHDPVALRRARPHEEPAPVPARVARRGRLAAEREQVQRGQRLGRRPAAGRESSVADALTCLLLFLLSFAPAGHQLVGQAELVEHAPDHGVQ